MNRIFRHKYTIFSLMAAMAMLMVSATGCIMDNEEPGTPDDEGLMMVSFRVVTPMPKSDGASRADNGTWGGDYDPEGGSPFDNKLLSDGFKVIITQEDCTPVAEVTRFWCIKTTTENQTKSAVYDFLGFIDNETDFDKIHELKNTGKLHVIANAGTDASLADATSFTYSGQESTNGFNAIPMWGVATVDFSGMTKGERFDAGEVWLLRAMAKVEIQVSPDEDNIITGLNSASLPTINASGKLLPTGWAAIEATEKLSYDNCFRENTTSIKTAISITEPAPVKKIEFYLPECTNTNNSLTLTVNYNDGTAKDGKIKFQPYDDDGKPTGAPYNIVRNHLYRFTVKATANDVNMSINWTVCPWGSASLNVPEFE